MKNNPIEEIATATLDAIKRLEKLSGKKYSNAKIVSILESQRHSRYSRYYKENLLKAIHYLKCTHLIERAQLEIEENQISPKGEDTWIEVFDTVLENIGKTYYPKVYFEQKKKNEANQKANELINLLEEKTQKEVDSAKSMLNVFDYSTGENILMLVPKSFAKKIAEQFDLVTDISKGEDKTVYSYKKGGILITEERKTDEVLVNKIGADYKKYMDALVDMLPQEKDDYSSKGTDKIPQPNTNQLLMGIQSSLNKIELLLTKSDSDKIQELTQKLYVENCPVESFYSIVWNQCLSLAKEILNINDKPIEWCNWERWEDGVSKYPDDIQHFLTTFTFGTEKVEVCPACNKKIMWHNHKGKYIDSIKDYTGASK